MITLSMFSDIKIYKIGKNYLSKIVSLCLNRDRDGTGCLHSSKLVFMDDTIMS